MLVLQMKLMNLPGAKIIESTEELFASGDIILKVQRPLHNESLNKDEIDLIKKDSLSNNFSLPALLF